MLKEKWVVWHKEPEKGQSSTAPHCDKEGQEQVSAEAEGKRTLNMTWQRNYIECTENQ